MSKWLDDIVSLLPRIQEVAESCSEKYRLDCFRLVLEHALGTLAENSKPQPSPDSIPTPAGPRLKKFLSQYSLSQEDLSKLIDPETGLILVRLDPKASKADNQRKLATLLALRSLSREDRFFVGYDDLRQACEAHACYDSNNFRRTMRTTTWQKLRVFTEADGGWNVSVPGEEFVAKTLLGFLGQDNE